MKNLRKIIISCVVICMTLLIVNSGATIVNAAEYTSGDYKYTLDSAGNAVISGYVGSDTEITIPGTIDGYKVKSVGGSAFSRNKTLVSVSFHENITSIDSNAFYNCTALKNVTFHDGIKEIGYQAFYGTAIEELVLPKQLTSCSYAFGNITTLHTVTVNKLLTQGIAAFEGATSLKNIYFEQGTTQIPGNLFRNTGLETVVIPDSVTKIGEYAFLSCENLTKVDIGNVTDIDGCAFASCINLTEVDFGEKLSDIGYEAFKNCGKLENITLPKSLKSMGSGVFINTSIKEVVIPENVTTMYGAFRDIDTLEKVTILTNSLTSCSGAFSNNTNLKTVVWGDKVTKIPIGILSYTGIESVVIPDRVTEIGMEAYRGCTMLEGVEFGSGVTTIGANAFAGCTSLTSVTIPEGITSIGVAAFNECAGLQNVYFNNEKCNIDYNAFGGVPGVLHASISSDALIYAIDNDKAFNISNTNYYDDDTKVLDRKNTFMYATQKNGKTELVVYFNLKNTVTGYQYESVSVRIPNQNMLGECYYNNVSFSPYYSSKKISKSTTDKSGVMSIMLDMSQMGDDTIVYARYAGETIGVLDLTGDAASAINTPIAKFVERMYTVALNRASDTMGKLNWIYMLTNGSHDGAGIAKEFILGAEFAMRGLSDAEYVDVLYQTFFDREADADGKNFWLAVLASGQTREFVLSNFVNLPEFTLLCESYGIERGVMLENGEAVNPGIPKFVKRLYTTVLGRPAENEGLYNNVLALVVRALTAEDVAKNFFGSEEYLLKGKDTTSYVRDLYAVFMGREADEAGLSFWVACIDVQGMTREQALSEFAGSAEFKIIAAGYGLE